MRLSQHIRDRFGGLSAHARQHVGAGVEGDRYAGVPQEFLDELGVDVLREQERRAGVEIVEGDLRESGALE